MRRLVHGVREHYGIAFGLMAILAVCLLGAWAVRVITGPLRYAGPAVDLSPYGLPGVTVKIVYPIRVNANQVGRNATTITVLARAREEGAVRSFELLLPLPDEALAYVDASGEHIAGRLWVTPGYPEANPHDLRVVHGQTQYRGYLFWPYRLTITPVLRLNGETALIPELTFSIRLISRWEQGLRDFSQSLATVMTPYLLLGALFLAAVWLGQRLNAQRRLARERRLSGLYARLREQIRLERWADAREIIEQIRAEAPRYRDIERIDAVVSAAEGAGWRREQLYNTGLQAYKARNWPDAVHAFQAVEQEAPYYREVRFLRRTAALYADLQSRDRSLRLKAAQELGAVADLLDMAPLLHALGDRSKEVAQAAEASFRQIGVDALDTLLAGLAYTGDGERATQVRERSYHLIEDMGQAARAKLVAALRSSDPRITSAAASLLIKLGARQEVAEALLWATPPHCEGIIKALLTEGVAAAPPLVQALLKTPADREQLLVYALIRLKSAHNIDRYVAEVMRSCEDGNKAALLKRVLESPTDVEYEAPIAATPARPQVQAAEEYLPPAQDAEPDNPQRSTIWPLRLLDRRRS